MKNNKIFYGSTLKLIAIIAMLIDHIGAIVLMNGVMLQSLRKNISDATFESVYNVYEVSHIIGQIAFPIFCFLVVEGFVHTRDLKKYMLRLGIFAVVTEPIYDISLYGGIFKPEAQNVLFVLLLGVATLWAVKKSGNNLFAAAALCAASGAIATVLHFDGMYYGIVMMVILYIFREKPALKFSILAVAMFLCSMNFSLGGLLDPFFLASLVSIVPMALYNGKRGAKIKYAFYIFYPAHLLVLYFVSIVVVKMING